MIKLFNYSALIFGLILISSCSGDASKTGSKSSSKASKDCLMSYDYDYTRILTLDDVKKHVAVDESTLETEQDLNNKTYGSVIYRWKSNRPDLVTKINNMEIEHPDMNKVSMTKLSFYDSDDLKTYKSDDFVQLFNRGYDPMGKDEFDKLFENLKKEYKDNPEMLETSRKLLETRMKSKYKKVDQVGQSAYWKWNDMWGLEMSVLYGNTKFYLEVKIDEDPQKNLDAATKIANDILAKCK